MLTHTDEVSFTDSVLKCGKGKEVLSNLYNRTKLRL